MTATLEHGHHRAWTEQAHADLFDYLRFTPSFALRPLYASFNEVRLLRTLIGRDRLNVLEVGCATGELYRYLRSTARQVTYVGCDISEPALRRARMKYPDGRFVQVSPDLAEVTDLRPDVVFCRDVVHHQPDPVAFLHRLYDLTTGHLILRLRTRDRGPSEMEPERSCQFMYGTWAPYIVMACADLVTAFLRTSPVPRRLVFLKHYMILGGQHGRYLPKECYDPATGTAETALLVEKKNGGGDPVIEEHARPDGPGHDIAAVRLAGRVVARGLKALLGSRYQGRTWW